LKKIFYILLCIILILTIQNAFAEPIEKEYGSVNAWFNGQEATVDNIELKINEPAEIRVEVISKIDGHVNVELTNPLVTESYKVISGPSLIDKTIDNLFAQT
jgi:sarcinarray family protein